ncbi:MAG: metal-dependent hydrolase [Patescibacteria group bacterium]
MSKLIKIIPFGWLADFGHGIILSILITHIFDIDYSILYLFFGILFSILPDLDAIDEFFKYKSVAASKDRPKDHRDGWHYPVIWVFVGVVITILDSFWGVFFLSSIIVHFLNDSWGTGWGIQWLWPISNKSYKFLSHKNKDAGVSVENIIVSWTPEEKKDVMSKLGNPNWVKDTYLTFNKISVIEIGTFILGIIFLFIFL